MPNGYKTDLVMFFQISRTMQRKRHAKRTSKALRNDPTTSPPQKLLCIKMAFGLVSLQYKSVLTAPMASERPKTLVWALSAPQSVEK
jgi:hypothetical protein